MTSAVTADDVVVFIAELVLGGSFVYAPLHDDCGGVMYICGHRNAPGGFLDATGVHFRDDSNMDFLCLSCGRPADALLRGNSATNIAAGVASMADLNARLPPRLQCPPI